VTRNVDLAVVEGFGDEWTRFDQMRLSDAELRELFESYFSEFPWSDLPSDPVGFDLGCGSGRWARFVAPRVGTLHCIDPSAAALAVASRALSGFPNVRIHNATVDEIPLADDSADFGYSLGVLHHVPDTPAAIRACVGKLRPGAPFLLYLYYALDNRPPWYRALWKFSEAFRFVISRMPYPVRYATSQVIAVLIYWPLARFARLCEALGMRSASSLPLAFYRRRGFYVMRTDALDRFGTRLEQRFTRAEIESMMRASGLTEIVFNPDAPFWSAVGRKA